MSPIPIARIFGIEIRIHVSWIVILAIITVGVGLQLGASQPDWSDALRWAVAASVAVLFFASVVAHELAHGLTARRRGMGGGVVTLLFFGGATTQGREPERPADEALVAGAGPTASLLVAIAFMALIVVGEALEGAVGDAISQLAVVVALLNLLLALLNLLPVYPLDGGRILHAALWAATGEEMRASRGVAIASRVLGWGLFGLGVGVMLTGDGVTALMLVACGWLLGGMARSVERRVALERLLRGVSVESVMERDLPAVAPQLTLDTFAAQYLATGEGTSLPVMRDDMLLGLIGISQLRGIRRSAWPTMHAADVMVSPPRLLSLAPDDEVWAALESLRQTGLDGLPVLKGSQLLGVLTKRGIVSAIQARGRGTAGAPS